MTVKGKDRVLFDALAFPVQSGKVSLPPAVALTSGRFVMSCSGGVVLKDTTPFLVHVPEIVLGPK